MARYTLFQVEKVNPTDQDGVFFSDSCKSLGAAYHGYHIIPMKTKTQFTGFVAFEWSLQPPTIERSFPNFLVSRVRH